MSQIPASSAEISVAWLNEVLDEAPQFGDIAEVTIEPVGEGVGILGEVVRLHLGYATGHTGPATLIAKCQSTFAENIFISQMMGFYQREVNFYEQLATSVDLRVPVCHHADISPEGTPFVLLLEEVTGATSPDQLGGATVEEAERVVDIAVALHSTFWDNDRLWSLDWLPPMNNDLYKATRELCAAKWEPFVATWGDRLPADIMAATAETIPKYHEMVDWWVEQGNVTLAHTDMRADNFLIGGSAGDDVVTVLDFQLLTRHVGVWDIAYFLGQSMTPEVRRESQDQLLRRYHDGLVAAGVEGYDFDRCFHDYRGCQFHQAMSQVAVSDLDPGNDRGRALLDAMITRSFQAASDSDAGDFTSYW